MNFKRELKKIVAKNQGSMNKGTNMMFGDRLFQMKGIAKWAILAGFALLLATYLGRFIGLIFLALAIAGIIYLMFQLGAI